MAIVVRPHHLASSQGHLYFGFLVGDPSSYPCDWYLSQFCLVPCRLACGFGFASLTPAAQADAVPWHFFVSTHGTTNRTPPHAAPAGLPVLPALYVSCCLLGVLVLDLPEEPAWLVHSRRQIAPALALPRSHSHILVLASRRLRVLYLVVACDLLAVVVPLDSYPRPGTP